MPDCKQTQGAMVDSPDVYPNTHAHPAQTPTSSNKSLQLYKPNDLEIMLGLFIQDEPEA